MIPASDSLQLIVTGAVPISGDDDAPDILARVTDERYNHHATPTR
jgi:hypothetical protein